MEIGRIFFAGLSDSSEETLEILKEFKPGGVILYPSVLHDEVSLYEILEFLAGERVFITTDHEGGQMETIPYIPSFPGNMALGFSNPKLTEEYARLSATIMKALGMNAVLAPVLDVHFPGSSAVIGLRSYGSDPKIVAERGVAAIKGYMGAGVVPCAKHFPGHGRSKEDSHEGKVIVDASFEEMWNVDIYPFKRAVEAGVPMVMTAHITVPAVEDLPATLSEFFIGEVLRKKLGFKGIVVSDAVEMKAIWDYFDPREVVRMFFKAGGDMIIVSDVKNLPLYCEALEKEMDDPDVREKVEDALEKIERITPVAERGFSMALEVARNASKVKASKLPRKIHLVVPKGENLSQADTSASYYERIEKVVRRLFEVEGVTRYEIFEGPPEVSADVILDIVVDGFRSEKALKAHRNLGRNSRVVYLIIRDPRDADLLDGEKVITHSMNPVAVYEALKNLL